MLASINKVAIVVGLLAMSLTAVNAQDPENNSKQPAQNKLSIEEITVTGQRSFYLLRAQVESAKITLYSNYNQFNLDDDMDIECRRTDYTESLINNSRCWPVFFDKLVADNSQRSIENGDLFIIPPQQLARQYSDRFDELRMNIMKIAAEYPSVSESLMELGTLQEALKRKKENCMQQPAVLFIFRRCP